VSLQLRRCREAGVRPEDLRVYGVGLLGLWAPIDEEE